MVTEHNNIHKRHLVVFHQTNQVLSGWNHTVDKPDIRTLSLFTGYSEESILESLEFGHPSMVKRLQGSSDYLAKAR